MLRREMLMRRPLDIKGESMAKSLLDPPLHITTFKVVQPRQ